ncbi:hypothetical protein HDU85_003805 [Gaertneriomyces sp. JEL0708]|nr:hypothetical protein HDU85_003805 [Gaertneriomyces sp. JEL0708]
MSCPVTITTFNIRFGSAADGPNAWRNRCELLLETICELNSDILCMQEAERFQIEEIVDGLKVRGKMYEWIAWNAACQRICTFALLRLRENENNIMVFNTHLDHVSAEARLKGVELILGRVKKSVELLDEEQRCKLDFVVLAGDFNNQGLRDAEVRRCIDAGFEDGYYMKHRNYNGGTFHAFTGRPLGLKTPEWLLPIRETAGQVTIFQSHYQHVAMT